MPLSGDSQRRAASSTPAPICTDGPCRPTDSPASRLAETPAILSKDSRSETKALREASGVSGASATSTCGTPEPAMPGAQRRTAQTISAVAAGVQTSGAHQTSSRPAW